MKYILVTLIFVLAGFFYYTGMRHIDPVGTLPEETTPCHTWDSQGNCVHGHILICPPNWICKPYPYDHTKYSNEWGTERNHIKTTFEKRDDLIGGILFLYGPLVVVTLFFLTVFIVILLIVIRFLKELLI